MFTLAPAPFPLQEVQDLAVKGRLLSTNASIVLFARKPTLPSLCWLTATGVTLDLLSERRVFLHVRAASYAPLGYAGLPSNGLLLRGRYAHPSNARTLSLVDWHGRLHPVVDSQLSQVPSTKKLATTGSLPHQLDTLPEGGGVAVGTDLFCPLPATTQGDTLTLPFSHRVSRSADMFAVTAAEIKARCRVRIMSSSKSIFPSGIVREASSEIKASSFARRFRTLYAHKLLVVRTITASFYHPNGDDGAERVNSTR